MDEFSESASSSASFNQSTAIQSKNSFIGLSRKAQDLETKIQKLEASIFTVANQNEAVFKHD